MTLPLELSGQSFTRLTALELFKDRTSRGGTLWKCRCECGNEIFVRGTDLKSGNTRSCGCLQKEWAIRNAKATATHGMSNTSIFSVWCGMMKRCRSKTARHYKDYGGRGIKVCRRWLKFENFFSDMGFRPDGMSLDRIDNDGDYKPSNCRWANLEQQNNNRRSSSFINYDGHRLTVSQWARKIGIPHSTLFSRLNVMKWSVERALSDTKYCRPRHV
jgi:hypothetical protein